jgi:mRNA interferase MazF
MKQYEIRWVRLPEPIGVRPLLLLSRTTAYGYLKKVLTAEVTTRIRGIAQEVRLGSGDGMPKPCAANLDNIQLVPTSSIGQLITTLRAKRIVEVKRAVGHALFWAELMGL